MQIPGRAVFQFLFFSLALIWILFARSANQGEALCLAVFAVIIGLSFIKITKPVSLLKLKFNDRDLFIDDFLKAVQKQGFAPIGNLGRHYFFQRFDYLRFDTKTIELKFAEENECLITAPSKEAARLGKALQNYTELREREFLKETDKLMENP